MPFKSQAQRRKFAELQGKISNKTFEEWEEETDRVTHKTGATETVLASSLNTREGGRKPRPAGVCVQFTERLQAATWSCCRLQFPLRQAWLPYQLCQRYPRGPDALSRQRRPTVSWCWTIASSMRCLC